MCEEDTAGQYTRLPVCSSRLTCLWFLLQWVFRAVTVWIIYLFLIAVYLTYNRTEYTVCFVPTTKHLADFPLHFPDSLMHNPSQNFSMPVIKIMDSVFTEHL